MTHSHANADLFLLYHTFWCALYCLYANTLNYDISIYALQRLFCGLIHCIVNAYFFITNHSAWSLFILLNIFLYLSQDLFLSLWSFLDILSCIFAVKGKRSFESGFPVITEWKYISYACGRTANDQSTHKICSIHYSHSTHYVYFLNCWHFSHQPCCSYNSYKSWGSWMKTCQLQNKVNTRWRACPLLLCRRSCIWIVSQVMRSVQRPGTILWLKAAEALCFNYDTKK